MSNAPTDVGIVRKVLVVRNCRLETYVAERGLIAELRPQSGPAFAGNADPGINWHCARCDAVLASAVYPGQFLDVAFKCYVCGQLGASPRRQPGQPLAGRPLLIPPGAYRLDSVIQTASEPVMVVGQQALDGYLLETGRIGAPVRPRLELTTVGLSRLAKEAADLLGENYESLRASDARGQASATTPPRRHRLIELINYAQQAASALEHRKPGESVRLDAFKIAELDSLLQLFARWTNHPAWKRLVVSLENEVNHTHILLALASYFCDAGNGVGIVSEDQPGQRIADLWVQPTLVERLDVEIKAPVNFFGPLETPLSDDVAEKAVERHVKKAASAKSGQLDTDFSGIVAFGTFYLTEADTQKIVSACEHLLERQRNRKQHLTAITVSAFHLLTETTAGVVTGVTPAIQTTVVRHPGYRGSLTLEETPQPWQPGFPG